MNSTPADTKQPSLYRRIALLLDPDFSSGDKRVHFATRFVKFILLGIPFFLVAIPMNYLLVEWAGLNKQLAYAIVLFAQINVNLFLLKIFLFRNKEKKATFREYFSYMSGMSFFRLLDWGLYSLLIPYAGKYYLAVQVLNTILFLLLKFIFSKHILEPKKR